MVRAQVYLPPALLGSARREAACVGVAVDSQGGAVVPQGCGHQGAAIQCQIQFCNMSDRRVINLTERDIAQNTTLRNSLGCTLGRRFITFVQTTVPYSRCVRD